MLDVNFGTRFFIDISIFLFFYFFGYCILFLLGFFGGVGGVGLGVFVCFVCVCFVCVFFFLLLCFFVLFLLNIRFLGGLPVRVENSFLRRYKISICFGFFLILYLIVCFRFFYLILFFTLYAICSGFTCDRLRINWALREFHVLFLTWKNTHVNFSRKNILTWFTPELNFMVKVKDAILWCRSLYFFHQIFA